MTKKKCECVKAFKIVERHGQLKIARMTKGVINCDLKPKFCIDCGKRLPQTHELKCWTRYFEPIIRGQKTFEIRENDRDFKKGDIVVLREYNEVDGGYTGSQAVAEIGYITNYSQMPGYVVFSLKGLSWVPEKIQ